MAKSVSNLLKGVKKIGKIFNRNQLIFNQLSILFLKDIIIQNKYQEVKNIKLIKSIVTPILHIFLVRRQSAN